MGTGEPNKGRDTMGTGEPNKGGGYDGNGRAEQGREIRWGSRIEIEAPRVIRSRRQTLCVQIRDGEVVVKAPLQSSDREIEEFLAKHQRWISSHLERARQRRQTAQEAGALSMEEIEALARQALEVIPERVRHYAPLMGVTYGRITIRNQRTRWGSCSSKGNLNFNCLLMLCPAQVIDSVVVHELAHRIEMNHSDRFYAQVLRVFPEYRRWELWLKENGPVLMARMKG